MHVYLQLYYYNTIFFIFIITTSLPLHSRKVMLSDFVLCVTEVTECKCVHPVGYRAEATCLCVLVGDVGSVEVRSSL